MYYVATEYIGAFKIYPAIFGIIIIGRCTMRSLIKTSIYSSAK